MWTRFSEQTRRIIFFAQEEAARKKTNLVGTEHFLLGVTREDDTAAAKILSALDISLSTAREEMEKRLKIGSDPMGEEMHLTERAKRVLDLATESAKEENMNVIGTEHLLFGLLKLEEGVGSRVLLHLGANLERAREAWSSLQHLEDTTDAVEILTDSGIVILPLADIQSVKIQKKNGEEVEGRALHAVKRSLNDLREKPS